MAEAKFFSEAWFQGGAVLVLILARKVPGLPLVLGVSSQFHALLSAAYTRLR